MNNRHLKRVLIMAGGTGGHVFPGLALAKYFREMGVLVHWLGTPFGLEAKLVVEAGIPFHTITVRGLRGKGIKPLLKAPFSVTQAVLQARKIINSIKPDVTIGMGGFVSGPGGVASWILRCPLLIHEQNAIPGLTNRLLGKFAKKILEGFPGAFKAHPKVVAVGSPVRAEIENIAAPDLRFQTIHSSRLRLLILGGSLGAKAINEIIPQMMKLLDQPIDVIHQTGQQHIESTKNTYETMGLQGDVKPFIEDMASVYQWADLVICRAGALTVSELCVAGLGAIFIPYPFAVDDHQTANANFMVKNKAAVLIQQNELTAEALADIVRTFVESRQKCLHMAKAAYHLRRIGVAQNIYQICQEVSR